MPYAVEMTDTFGGEANYSWVKRGVLNPKMIDGFASRKSLVRQAKKFAGFNGFPATVTDMGDTIEIRPASRYCVVVFVDWVDDEPVVAN